MFSTPRINVIESDAGFSVEVLGRVGLLYREGDRTIRIDSEILAPNAPSAMAVRADSIKHWSSPTGKEEIDRPTRLRIVGNIRDAFRSQGYEIDVIVLGPQPFHK